MAVNSEIKHHVSAEETSRWDKTAKDFSDHHGAGGVENHPLGDGLVPGFSEHNLSGEILTQIDELEKKTNNVNKVVFGDIDTNPFLVEFRRLYGLELLSGVWNEPLIRLECGRGV